MPKDIRDAFFDRICKYAFRDDKVVIITDDMDIFSLRKFKRTCPNRFINAGVAEQQIINCAAGLAAEGKKVIVCGIASFVTFRCYEQIKVNICSMKLPVVIVGLGVGLSFSFDGPTHHGIQDISVMRSLPEIDIYNPCDTDSAQKCADIAYLSECPVYVRIDKGMFPDIYNEHKQGLEYGYCNIKTAKDINIVSTGLMTHIISDIIKDLEFDVGLFDVFKAKPFDNMIINELSHSHGIITIEEHAITGGLYSIVLEEMSKIGSSIPVKSIALEDGQYLKYGTREFLQEQYGLSKDRIINDIQSFEKSVMNNKM